MRVSLVSLVVLVGSACVPGNQYWKFQRDIEYGWEGTLPFEDGQYCAGVNFDRNIDYEGNGETFREENTTATCFTMWSPEPDRIRMLHRILEVEDGPDHFCQFDAQLTSDGIGDVTGGMCLWDNGERQIRADITGGITEQDQFGFDADATFESIDLVDDQVQLGTEGVYAFNGAYWSEEPGPTDDLLTGPSDCALDGCWSGTLTGSVVSGDASCEALVDTLLPSTTAIELTVSAGMTSLARDDEAATSAFLDLFTCDVYGTTGEVDVDQWRYHLADDGTTVTGEARYLGQGCELLYTGEVNTCAR